MHINLKLLDEGLEALHDFFRSVYLRLEELQVPKLPILVIRGGVVMIAIKHSSWVDSCCKIPDH